MMNAHEIASMRRDILIAILSTRRGAVDTLRIVSTVEELVDFVLLGEKSEIFKEAEREHGKKRAA